MTYTPTEWKNGDTITAEKLNNMEQGIVDAGGLVVPTFELNVEDEITCNLSYSEIESAVLAGKCCYAFYQGIAFILSLYTESAVVGFVSTYIDLQSHKAISENIEYASDGMITYYKLETS